MHVQLQIRVKGVFLPIINVKVKMYRFHPVMHAHRCLMNYTNFRHHGSISYVSHGISYPILYIHDCGLGLLQIFSLPSLGNVEARDTFISQPSALDCPDKSLFYR